MQHAKECKWGVVVNGADRGELSRAFSGSEWQDTWTDSMSLLDDSDPDAGYVVTLPVSDLNTLVAVLRCVGHLRPTHGISLYGNADFGSLRASFSLCTVESGFTASDCSLSRTGGSVGSVIESKLTVVDKSLGELRILLAERDAS